MAGYFEPKIDDDAVNVYNEYFVGWINNLADKYGFVYGDVSKNAKEDLMEDLALEYWNAWSDFDRNEGTSFKTFVYSYLNNFIRATMTEWNRRKEKGFAETIPVNVENLEGEIYVREFADSVEELVDTMVGASSLDKLLDRLRPSELALVEFILNEYSRYKGVGEYRTVELPVEVEDIESPDEAVVMAELPETIEVAEDETSITKFWQDLRKATGWYKAEVVEFFKQHPDIKELLKDKAVSLAKKVAGLKQLMKIAS